LNTTNHMISQVARQVGGQVGGSVGPGLNGFVSGVVGSSTLAGCIGGKLPNGLGATLCFPPKFALPTRAVCISLPLLAARQLANID
jgi:hypothetical protein